MFLPLFIIFLIRSPYLSLDFLVLNFYFYLLFIIIRILNRYRLFRFILSYFSINNSHRRFRSRKKNDSFDLWLSYSKIQQVFQFLYRLGYLQAKDSFLIDEVYDFLTNRQGWLDYNICWFFDYSNNIKGVTVNIYQISNFDSIVFITLIWFFRGSSRPFLGTGSATGSLSNSINYFIIRDVGFEQISLRNWKNLSSPYLTKLGISSQLIELAKKFYTIEGV